MRYLYIILFFVTYLAQGQVGIGTDTPISSARLEVSANDKGFLPPRIALSATNTYSPIDGPSAAGLLIYNTATNGSTPFNVTPGYYYWNGAAWIKIAGGLIVDSKTSSFSLASTDNNKVFIVSSSSALTITVPSDLPIGFSCQIIQGGTGVITVSGASGVTINGAHGLKTRSINSIIGIIMNSSSLGYVFGDTLY